MRSSPEVAETLRKSHHVAGLVGAVVGALGPRYARVSAAAASWLGLTPRESSTGNRRYLGRISKRGDVDLRCLLTHGARAVLLTAQRTARMAPHRLTRFQHWAVNVAARRGHNTAAIAVANTLARIIWAVWHREIDFQPTALETAAA
jgi:transposase